MIPASRDLLDVLSESSIRAAAIASIVWLILAALRVRAGALCHAAWTMVLVAMLLLPVFPKWLPALPVTLTPAAALSQPDVIAPGNPGSQVPSAPARNAGARESRSLTPVTALAQPIPKPLPRQLTPSWSSVAVSFWAAGAFVMLLRLAGGWRRALILRAATRQAETGSLVCESDLVSAPVVIGIVSPRIVVPAEWTSWPDEMRRAALTHEGAHIRRGDALVGLLSGLNRCIYWFHPLAWWLDRRLMSAAEQACDDEVVRSSEDRHGYAELLLQTAEAVRQRGGRVIWPSVGMAGAGSLGARVDRVLAGAGDRVISSTRRIVILALCLVVILPGLACQQGVAPLREDPEIAKNLQQQRERVQEFEAATAMTMQEVAQVEATVAANPDDLVATRRLITFYSQRGQQLIGWNEMVAARRKHLVRMIERHPDSDLVWWPLKQSLDPEGWAQARALWLKHLENPAVSSKVISAAARFFAISEKPIAEKILLKAQATDPKGTQPRVVGNVYDAPWSYRLGELYARAILGSDDETLGNVIRSVSLEEANGTFATAARLKLEETKDPALLRAAGGYLAHNARDGNEDGTIGDQKIRLGFDHRALGESYLDRSIALDPDSEVTKQFVVYRERSRASEARFRLLNTRLGRWWSTATPEQVAALSESDRLDVLTDLGDHAYMGAESTPKKYEERVALAKTFAEQALALSEKFKGDPRYARTVFEAHMILGVVAVREGDRRLAVNHLKAGADVANAEALQDLMGSLRPRLTNYLLKDGERDSVAQFFEKVSRVASPEQQEFADAAKAIREGRMPRGFQYAMTPH